MRSQSKHFRKETIIAYALEFECTVQIHSCVAYNPRFCKIPLKNERIFLHFGRLKLLKACHRIEHHFFSAPFHSCFWDTLLILHCLSLAVINKQDKTETLKCKRYTTTVLKFVQGYNPCSIKSSLQETVVTANS